MGLDYVWFGKAVSAVSNRPAHCPGFRLKNFDVAFQAGPRAGMHWNAVTKIPTTVLCDHGLTAPCQIGVEYEYFFMWLVANGKLGDVEWRNLRVPARSTRRADYDEIDNAEYSTRESNDRRGIPNYCLPTYQREGCMGFKLAEGPLAGRIEMDEDEGNYKAGWHYSPVSLAPYTEPCDHRECDPWVEVKWLMIRYYAMSMLPDGIERK